MAERLGCSLVCGFRPVPELLRRGESLEDGARRIRYDFLESVRISSGGWGVAVAHTSDDSAETFLMNLMRGTGVRGLVGIPERRAHFFRPLLAFSKDFLRELLQYHCVPWREDLSNVDNHHTRNRIRNRLFPLLQEEFNPRVKEALLGTAEDMIGLRRSEDEMREALFPLLKREIPFCSYACSLDSLRDLDEEILALFFRGVAIRLGLKTLSRERTKILCALVKRSSRWCFQWQKEIHIFCNFRLAAWVDPDILVQAAEQPASVHILKGPRGSFEWGPWRFSWRRECAHHVLYGTMSAVFPDIGSVETIPLSHSGKRFWKKDIPEWAFSLFPVLRSGTNQWIPYWEGRRSGNGCQAGIRMTAALPERKLWKEKVTFDDGVSNIGRSPHREGPGSQNP